MTRVLFALNAGSSSLKFAAFDATDADRPALLRGTVDRSQDRFRITARDGSGQDIPGVAATSGGDPQELVQALLALLKAQSLELCAIGHRIVHGGDQFVDPVRIDEKTFHALEALTPLAPLHQPAGLAPVKAISALRPDLTQVACFDTAFHQTIGFPARRYPLPRALEAVGIRRYGFHGLSFAFVAEALLISVPAAARARIVVAHLGSGCSLCAIKEGRSIDTTMGFTALDGLMMSTRPGSLDPGILLYLLQERGMTVSALENLLYHHSGLLGVSGISGDVRELLASDAPEAAAALDLFVYRIAKEIAAMATALCGLDMIVFTGGIGEHAASVRAAVCQRLGWLGITIEHNANRAASAVISRPVSRVEVRILATDEEAMIARGLRAVLGGRV